MYNINITYVWEIPNINKENAKNDKNPKFDQPMGPTPRTDPDPKKKLTPTLKTDPDPKKNWPWP